MDTKKFLTLVFIAQFMLATLTDAQFCFSSSFGGLLRWRRNCNWMVSQSIYEDANNNLFDCFNLCFSNPQCTHFAIHDNGCHLKSITAGQPNNFSAFQDSTWTQSQGISSSSFCGFIPSRTYYQGFPQCDSRDMLFRAFGPYFHPVNVYYYWI